MIHSDRKRDELHDELQKRMNISPKPEQKPQRERPQVRVITARSSVEDVGDWLDTKGFSQKCVCQLIENTADHIYTCIHNEKECSNDNRYREKFFCF